MKKGLLPIIALLLIICSCQHTPLYPPQFLVADSLASVQPDSAIALLEELKEESASWTKAERMYYNLLTVKARDKAYITHTSDSLMLQVLSYYEHGGDKRLLPEAYYYMGRTYRDMNDAPHALEYYQKAVDVMPGEEHLKIKTKVYAQIGSLFLYQRLYDKAMSAFQNSYQCDSILKDTVGIIYNLRDMALCYANTNRNELGIEYLKRAIGFAENIKNERMSLIASSQLASLYLQRGDYELAYDAIKPSLNHINTANVSSVYSIVASVHQHLNHRDSAFYYYNKLLVYGDNYAKAEAYFQLAKMSIENSENSELVTLLEQYYQQADTRKSLAATESLAQMNSLYNYQKAIEEREAITHQNNTNRWIIFLLSLSFIVIALCGIFVYKQMRNRREAMQYKMDEIKQNQQVAQIMAERSISEKNERIADLESQLQTVGDTNVRLTKQLEEQRAFIQQQIAYAQEKLEQKDDIDAKLNDSKIHSRLIYLINNKKKLGSKDLEELYATFQTVAPAFMDNLTGLCKMNDLEKEVTLLIRMGISPNDIASLTSYSKQHISGIRKGLYMKAKGVDAKPAKWDELVSLL